MRNDDPPLDFESLWNFSDPSGTERAFRDRLAAIGAEAEESYRLQLLTQLARTLGLQRRFDEAHQMLDEIEPRLADADATVAVRYELERGRVFNSSGRRDEARPLFEAAWQRACEAGLDVYAVDAAHMVAIVAQDNETLRWNRLALDLAERSASPRARNWLGSLYNNIGWTLHDAGDYAQALEIFEKAVAFRAEQQQPRELRIARWCVARALRSLGQVEAALARQYALEAEWKEFGEDDGYVFEELGECLLALGRTEAARPWFARAHATLSCDAWLAAEEPQRLERLQTLGQDVG